MPPFCVSPTHCGWFQTLKNSARNWRLVPRSWLKTKFLNTDRFQLSRPGPRTPLWGSLPQVPGAGTEKTEVSNHSLTVWGFNILPSMFGRLAVLRTMLATFWPANPMFSGAPERAVTIPDTSQPPRVVLIIRFPLFRGSGIRYTKLLKRLLLMSNAEGPKSYFHP